jgi:predicted thioredoxin/glutaredoxin
MPPTLEIYIASGCPNCRPARRLARLVKERLPEVRVRLIDLSEPGVSRPETVFAVPTYMLDGQTYSLGNPGEAKLMGDLVESIGRHSE